MVVAIKQSGGATTGPLFVPDSLPFGRDNDCTQIPFNPEDYVATPHAQELLAREDASLVAVANIQQHGQGSPEQDRFIVHGLQSCWKTFHTLPIYSLICLNRPYLRLQEGPPPETAAELPDMSEFPEVPEHETVTRRDQFAAKDSLAGRGRGRGRGRGGRATAAKSKLVRKASDGTLEGGNSSGSTGPVEATSQLRRSKRPVGDAEVSEAKMPRGEDEDEAEHHVDDEDAGSRKRGRPKAKAKAKAKGKAKAQAKAKAASKAKPKAKAKARAVPDASGDSEAVESRPKRKAPVPAEEKFEAAQKRTASLLQSMQKPAPLDFGEVAHDRPLPNPDHVRKVLVFEIMTCLASCNELGKKAKHNHVEKLVSPSCDMRFELYWSRASVGIKTKSPREEGFKQVVYFSRPTVCVGSNIVLAKYWVSWLCW